MMRVSNQASDWKTGADHHLAPVNRSGDDSLAVVEPPASTRARAGRITSRLLNLDQAAEYLGISYWSVRDMVQSGMLASVRFPAPRARDGRTIRRTLIDRQDLDQLVDQWKERNVA
jgi:excisionase family DNA binding protein